MGATTGGRGGADPQKLDGPPTIYVAFWWGSGGDNRLRQTGYTLLNFFWTKGSNTSDQEIGPPNFENVVAPLLGLLPSTRADREILQISSSERVDDEQ